MSNFFHSIAPTLIALTLACASAVAHATDNNSKADMSGAAPSHVETAQQSATAGTGTALHGLTRREVYNQLVQAERDGTLARLNALYYGP